MPKHAHLARPDLHREFLQQVEQEDKANKISGKEAH